MAAAGRRAVLPVRPTPVATLHRKALACATGISRADNTGDNNSQNSQKGPLGRILRILRIDFRLLGSATAFRAMPSASNGKNAPDDLERPPRLRRARGLRRHFQRTETCQPTPR